MAILTMLLLGACNSKNPDSLIGMNIDENPAVTNSGDDVEAPEATDAGAAPVISMAAKDAPAADRKVGSGDEETTAESGANGTDEDIPAQDERELNQGGNDVEPLLDAG